MPRRSRLALALLLATALVTTAALADGPFPRNFRLSAVEAPAPTNVLARLWSFVARLWSKNGCSGDPHGHCLPATGSATTSGDNGCSGDPDGRCNG
jgi:hypothetical protein